MNDIITTLIVYFITLIGLFIHAHRSRPELVKPFWKAHILSAIRLSFPFILIHMAFAEFNISALLGYGILSLLIFTSFCIPNDYIGIFFLVSAYVFYQWTFWFPDRHEFILKEKLDSKNKERRNSLVGKSGISKTPLKPSGKIQIDDREYDATCDSGFLEAEQSIKVTKIKAFGLVVEKL